MYAKFWGFRLVGSDVLGGVDYIELDSQLLVAGGEAGSVDVRLQRGEYTVFPIDQCPVAIEGEDLVVRELHIAYDLSR
jgi:hypothetical protein